MGENYDDLVKPIEEQLARIREQMKKLASSIDSILAELERSDLKMQVLDGRYEKIMGFMKIFGKNDAEIARNLEKTKIKPKLPIKKEFRKYDSSGYIEDVFHNKRGRK